VLALAPFLIANEQLTFLLLPPHCLHCYSNEGAQFILSHSIIMKNRDRRQRRAWKRKRMQSMLEAKMEMYTEEEKMYTKQ
jgi:hypothetical protein